VVYAGTVVLIGLLWALSHVIVWLVLVPLAVGGLCAREHIRARHQAEAEEDQRTHLFAQSFLPAADLMSGTQFEQYVAQLMRTGGARDVRARWP
jgi:hypothetical protein